MRSSAITGRATCASSATSPSDWFCAAVTAASTWARCRQEVLRERRDTGITTDVSVRTTVSPTHQVLFQRLITDGASFWSEVYEPFMARDLTRHEVRELVRLGLEHTRGNYKMLVTSFNMPPEDYKKFLNFLRKYQCHVPFQRFRMMPAPLQGRSSQVVSA